MGRKEINYFDSKCCLHVGNSIELAALSEKDHAHMPYIVILIHALNAWSREHGSAPASMAEREEFKKIVAGMSRHPELLGS